MNEFLTANMAREVAFFCVTEDVMVKLRFGTKSFVAVRTPEFEIDAVHRLMSLMTAK